MPQCSPMKNIVILISGTGSNMAALLRASVQQQWAQRYEACVAAVLSNRAVIEAYLGEEAQEQDHV